MSNSTNLALPYLAEGQAQKHVTLNETIRRLDAIVHLTVESCTTAAEPGAPADGQRFILPADKSGAAWAAFASHAIAYYRDGSWEQVTPKEGWLAWVKDAAALYRYTGSAWAAVSTGGGSVSRNRLINAAFSVNQRGAASSADDTYCFDRWYILTQSAPIAASALSNPEDGRPTGIRLTQSHASPQRIGIAQIVESANVRDLRSAAVAMAARVRCSSSQTIRMAILEWTGTADNVTSDVVNDWTSSAFTAGNFFLGSNLNVIATGATTPAANTWTDLDELDGTMGAALNNAIVMVWTEGTLANSATLDLNSVQFEAGAAVGDFVAASIEEELEACLRYFELMPGVGGAPGVSPFAQKAAGIVIDCFVNFKVAKRAIPALVTSSPTFLTGNPTTNNQLGFYNNAASSYATATGSVSHSIQGASTLGAIFRAQAATSFSGTNGDVGNFYLGAATMIAFDAEL